MTSWGCHLALQWPRTARTYLKGCKMETKKSSRWPQSLASLSSSHHALGSSVPEVHGGPEGVSGS